MAAAIKNTNLIWKCDRRMNFCPIEGVGCCYNMEKATTTTTSEMDSDAALFTLPPEILYLIFQQIVWDIASLLSVRRASRGLKKIVDSVEGLHVDVSALFPLWQWSDPDLFWETDLWPQWRRRGVGGRGVLARATQVFSLFRGVTGLHVRRRFCGRDSLHKLALGFVFAACGVMCDQVNIEIISASETALKSMLERMAALRGSGEWRPAILTQVSLRECWFDNSEGCACCFKTMNTYVQRVWFEFNGDFSNIPFVVNVSNSQAPSLDFLKLGFDFYAKGFPRPIQVITSQGSIDTYSAEALSGMVVVGETGATL